MRVRVTHIEFPVFMDYVIHVEVTSDIYKSMSKYPATENIPSDDTTHAITVHVDDEPFTFIFLPHNVSVGTVAHESWHAIRRMMNYVDVELDSETVAYHLGYLVNRIYQFYRGKK